MTEPGFVPEQSEQDPTCSSTYLGSSPCPSGPGRDLASSGNLPTPVTSSSIFSSLPTRTVGPGRLESGLSSFHFVWPPSCEVVGRGVPVRTRQMTKWWPGDLSNLTRPPSVRVRGRTSIFDSYSRLLIWKKMP